MKKKMMAFILSIIMAAGNMGIVPVFAEEEPVDETPQEIEEETEQTEEETEDAVTEEDDEQDIPAVSGNEAAETVSEEKAGEDISDPQEPAGDENDGNETEPGQGTEGGEGETDTPEETEPLILDVTCNPQFSYGSNENEEWFSYSTFINALMRGYNDGNASASEDFAEAFSGNPSGMLYTYIDGNLTRIESSTDIVDLSSTYYYGIMYPLCAGYDPTGKIVVKVNGNETEWTVAEGYLVFPILVHEGTVLDFPVTSDDNFEILSGQSDAVYQPDSRKIVSFESSDSTILKVERLSGYRLSIHGLKNGKAVLTVKGENGSVGKYTVTVKSFLGANAITINSGGSKTVDFDGAQWYEIDSVKSADAKIAGVDWEWDGRYFTVTGKYPGKTTITVKKDEGEISTLTVTVKPALKSTTKTPSAVYGTKTVTGKTTPGATVTAKIGKKTYKATANKWGKYTVKIPVVKIGTKVTMKFTSAGTSLSKTVKVKKSPSKIETTYWVYKNSTKVRGKATKVHAGDYIKVTIDGKTYKKKITKNANSLSFSIPIKKPGKYGIKMKTELYNKFNQRLAIENEYVYLSDTVYVGYTKSTVRWLTYWNDPDKKNYYTYSEQWCYDWSGDGYHDAYLYFRNGKVTSWQIYDD